MTLFRLLMITIITVEISLLSYAFAKKGKNSKTVNFFILYGVSNILWFILQLVLTSPIVDSDNALLLFKIKAFSWNIPTLLYLLFILSLTSTKIKKTIYLLSFTELSLFIYTILSNNVITNISSTLGIYSSEIASPYKLIPALNIIPMFIVYFILIKKYNKKINYTKQYLILFYLSFLMLITIPITHFIPTMFQVPLYMILPFWSFINSIVTFIVVRKLFLSIDYEEFTNELFNNIHDAILVADKEDSILIVNEPAYKMIAPIIKMELINQKINDIFENYNTNIEYKNFRIKLQNSKKEFLISKSTMSSKYSEFKSVIILKDLSSEKMLQEELIKSQKLESISVFVGGVAHDFSNILTAILGNTTYVKMKLNNQDNEIETTLCDTEKIILKAKNLTNQLLEYTKVNKENQKKVISLNATIKSSISLALSGSSIAIKFNNKDKSSYIKGDKVQLEQVFNNLLINAKQAMGTKGKIDIKINKIEIKNQYIQFIKPGNYLVISVKDNGKGIPKEKLHKIFTPYFTTKTKGNGLGLAIVSSIIENHNGYVNVESEINKGTKFTIYLPSVEKKTKKTKKTKEKLLLSNKDSDLINKTSKSSIKKGKTKVLIMDDEEMILKITKKLLIVLNYEVVTMKTGTDVLNYIKNNPRNDISMYILDLTIPGDIGGKELAPKIKELYPNSQIIVSSGYATKDEVINYKNYSFDNKLTKPYTIDDLKEILREKTDV